VTVCDEKDNYRFGFNGMEKDNEVKGIGNSLDFGERIYDSRLGTWMSIDKMAGKHPGFTPYVFCRDNPIVKYDPNGNTDYSATVQIKKNAKGEITKTITVNMVYAVLNVSSTPIYNANAVSGGDYKASAFTGSTSYKENGKTVNVNIQTNIQYRQVDNINQVRNGENVMLIVDDVKRISGDKHGVDPIARGAFEGNVVAVEAKYKNNRNTIWHEMGHNLGMWFPDNKQDPMHSPSPSNLM
jgi:RHS repeat-associated protein